jgi:hypothetical protein
MQEVRKEEISSENSCRCCNVSPDIKERLHQDQSPKSLQILLLPVSHMSIPSDTRAVASSFELFPMAISVSQSLCLVCLWLSVVLSACLLVSNVHVRDLVSDVYMSASARARARIYVHVHICAGGEGNSLQRRPDL